MRYVVVAVALLAACTTHKVAYISTPGHGIVEQLGGCKQVVLATNQSCVEETVADGHGSDGAGTAILSVLLLGGVGMR